MIDTLKLKSFRIFPDLEIAGLKRINLFAGANNTGKTAILEALYLLFADGPDRVQALPSVFRNKVSFPQQNPAHHTSDDLVTFWRALFHDGLRDGTPIISAKIRHGDLAGCRLQQKQGIINIGYAPLGADSQPLPQPPEAPAPPDIVARTNWNVSFTVDKAANLSRLTPNPFACSTSDLSTKSWHPSRDVVLYNDLQLKKGRADKLLHLLQKIDPRLNKLLYATQPETSGPQIYTDFGGSNALCITQAGQGFNKLFSLYCQVLSEKSQVLLIDEIEDGLYYKTLPEIWRGIADLAESENIQVFATTHSRECIAAAHEVMKARSNYDFALHRLQWVRGKLEAVTHDREMLDAALDSEMEVR